jgi:signal transduction histidine kinase
VLWTVVKVFALMLAGAAAGTVVASVQRRRAGAPAPTTRRAKTNWRPTFAPGQINLPLLLLPTFAFFVIAAQGSAGKQKWWQWLLFPVELSVLFPKSRRLMRVTFAGALTAAVISCLGHGYAAIGDAMWILGILDLTDTSKVLVGDIQPDSRRLVTEYWWLAPCTIAITVLVPLVGRRDRTLIWNHPVTARNLALDATLVASAWMLGYLIQLWTERVVQRTERERHAVLEERARLARELHDVVAHDLSVVVIQAQAAQLALPDDPARATGDLASIERAARDALGELRRLIGVLRENEAGDQLQPQPGLHNIDDLIRQMNDAGLDVELAVSGEARGFPAGASLSAFRIVQEALTNTRKHAGSVRAHVSLAYTAEGVDLQVTDEGVMASAGVGGSGHGLVGMRERVAMFGGQLTAGPRDEGGWIVEAHIPLNGTEPA